MRRQPLKVEAPELRLDPERVTEPFAWDEFFPVDRPVEVEIGIGKGRFLLEAAEPVSIWEEDLSEVWAAIEELRAQGVTDFRRYFVAHPEFVRKASGLVRVLDVNDATLTMLGVRDRARLLGPLDVIFGDLSLEMFMAELVAIAERHTSFEGDFQGANVRGERLDCHVSIAIPSEGSEFNNLLVCLTDITERRKAEEPKPEPHS